ncbi:MAG: hypothetical protein OK455_02710 [Thaumarchaeota archaeon]|nr:hypothetical protein [Nitrososphaerota archaeon]
MDPKNVTLVAATAVALTSLLITALVLSDAPNSSVVSTITVISTHTEQVVSTRLNTVTATTTTHTVAAVQSTTAGVAVEITSLQLIPPYFPVGPTFNATVFDAGTQAVTNVTIVLENRTFSFPAVTFQNPLLPGQYAHYNFTIDGGYTGEPPYTIMVYGTFQDGLPFAFIETVNLR